MFDGIILSLKPTTYLALPPKPNFVLPSENL